MLRKNIIKKHINNEEIHHVVSHNWSVLIKGVLKTFLFLLILYVLFAGVTQYSDREYRAWIFAAIWIYLLVRFVINFLNLYLDALILTESWVTLFMREWLLEYKTDVFERERIETISHTQNSIWDKIFAKWDIMIRLEHWVEFPFDNVSRPKKQAAKILRMKEYFNMKQIEEDAAHESNENQKFNILIEALGEVVQEYMDKWKKKSESEEDDNY